MRHHVARTLGATTLTLVLALGAAGCGDDATPADKEVASATEHNAADVRFAADMLQHHAQALSMVDLTLERPLDPEVVELAEQVRAAQAPEIEIFSDWLTEWDEEIPATMRDHANAGHDVGDPGEAMEGVDSDVPAMLTAEEMTALAQAPDDEFQTRWLEMMVEHHTGAVEMAQAHTEDGQYEPTLALAEDIVAAQTAEIGALEDLLGP